MKVVEIGAQDVNGSVRDFTPSHFEYIGVDFIEAKGVDIVLTDPYKLPFDDGSLDVVISSSCFEHSEFFWLLFMECMRVLKPKGLFYLNVPSNADFHRFPVDCWRFYPDSGRALVSWAKRNGMNPALLESFVSAQKGDVWNDFIGVFLKDEAHVADFPNRIMDSKRDFNNGLRYGSDEIFKYRVATEDQIWGSFIPQFVKDKLADLRRSRHRA